jgi:hypothetical protein
MIVLLVLDCRRTCMSAGVVNVVHTVGCEAWHPPYIFNFCN